nr:retrotransposon protein, putative, Ty1-copia subclass [Tanacetum cinerariifolium]
MANVSAQTRTAFRSMLEKHTLTGPNFNEWFRALKLVVLTEKIQDVFETALSPRPVGVGDAPVDPQALAEWIAKYDRHNEGDRTSISDHFILMKSYLDQLASLNYTFDDKIAIGFILESLTSGKVHKKPHGKAKAKGKAKGGQYSYPSKTKKPQPQKKERPAKEGQKRVDKWLPLHLQGFRGARKLKRGSLYLYVGNGMRAEVEAIGSFDLHLPNGLIIVLDNCHYAPTITRAHIDKKRITKLQKDGILKSTDNEPYDKYESCISGNMTKKPFSHKTEKVNDVLGLIHTDVCGPLRHVSKKGASYFITFTDDYFRYGYVYLLKHKHEVFETFKVFKNEVENQLGKTVKVLRFDRGGEYISQEFKDYLKACRIVQQLTPPYTPQHNGVSERPN